MRIALFITCFNDTFFPGTGVALVRLLRELGHEVTFPAGQTCCGQVHFNTGYRPETLPLVRRFLEVFEGEEVVVSPSASCVAMVREHYPVLAREAGDPDLARRAEALGSRIYEMTRFLSDELEMEDLGASYRGRVALHPTCHSLRGLDLGPAPERLLRAVRGLELVELPNAGECCGFGGTFSVKNPDTSLAMLSDKIQDILDSGADTLTAVDNSCLMHIAGGLSRRGLLRGGRPGLGAEGPGGHPVSGEGSPVGTGGDGTGEGIRVCHLAEILASGLGGSGDASGSAAGERA
jgi:L-lactate dehydrogenase complex protein LldE